MFQILYGRRRIDGPTPHQIRILSMLASGLSTDEVAATLHRSRLTVDDHLRDVYRRMGVANRAHAIAEGFRRGLLH